MYIYKRKTFFKYEKRKPHFDFVSHLICSPSELSKIFAVSVKDLAFKRPKPKRWLYWNPAAFWYQPGLFSKPSDEDVWTTRCCKSLQVKFGLEIYDKDFFKTTTCLTDIAYNSSPSRHCHRIVDSYSPSQPIWRIVSLQLIDNYN